MKITKDAGSKKSSETNPDPGKPAVTLGTFRDTLNAVLTLDVPRMGGKVVLTALVKTLGNIDSQDTTGLRATLQSTTNLESIQARANSGDPLAYGQLLYLATTATQMLAQVTNDHPKLAGPFVRVNPTWPILAIFYKSGEDDLPLDRLKRLKFGEVAGEVGIRKLTNKLGLTAWLLGIYGYLTSVVQAKSQPEQTSQRNVDAKAEWNQNARPTLDQAFPNLGDLPFEEAREIKTHRQHTRFNEDATMSGHIRFAIKTWYLKFFKFTHELRHIAQPARHEERKESK